jgi:hypothetical protein
LNEENLEVPGAEPTHWYIPQMTTEVTFYKERMLARTDTRVIVAVSRASTTPANAVLKIKATTTHPGSC